MIIDILSNRDNNHRSRSCLSSRSMTTQHKSSQVSTHNPREREREREQNRRRNIYRTMHGQQMMANGMPRPNATYHTNQHTHQQIINQSYTHASTTQSMVPRKKRMIRTIRKQMRLKKPHTPHPQLQSMPQHRSSPMNVTELPCKPASKQTKYQYKAAHSAPNARDNPFSPPHTGTTEQIPRRKVIP